MSFLASFFVPMQMLGFLSSSCLSRFSIFCLILFMELWILYICIFSFPNLFVLVFRDAWILAISFFFFSISFILPSILVSSFSMLRGINASAELIISSTSCMAELAVRAVTENLSCKILFNSFLMIAGQFLNICRVHLLRNP